MEGQGPPAIPSSDARALHQSYTFVFQHTDTMFHARGHVSSAAAARQPMAADSSQASALCSGRLHSQSTGSESQSADASPDSSVRPVDERSGDSIPPCKIQAYRERRERNNESARRSRAIRKARREEVHLRAVLLEQENLSLRAQIALLRQETTRLQYLLFYI